MALTPIGKVEQRLFRSVVRNPCPSPAPESLPPCSALGDGWPFFFWHRAPCRGAFLGGEPLALRSRPSHPRPALLSPGSDPSSARHYLARDPLTYLALSNRPPRQAWLRRSDSAIPRTRLSAASSVADAEGRGDRQGRGSAARRRAARAEPAVPRSRRWPQRAVRGAEDRAARGHPPRRLRPRGRCARDVHHLRPRGAGDCPRRLHRRRRGRWPEAVRLRRAGPRNDVAPPAQSQGGGLRRVRPARSLAPPQPVLPGAAVHHHQREAGAVLPRRQPTGRSTGPDAGRLRRARPRPSALRRRTGVAGRRRRADHRPARHPPRRAAALRRRGGARGSRGREEEAERDRLRSDPEALAERLRGELRYGWGDDQLGQPATDALRLSLEGEGTPERGRARWRWRRSAGCWPNPLRPPRRPRAEAF